MITLGAAIFGASLGIFLVEAKVVPGGASGLAMAIHYLSGEKIPVGIMMWGINVPLFIWGLKELGSGFGVKTFYGFTMSSIFTDFFGGNLFGIKTFNFSQHETIQSLLQHDFLFLVICGACTMGIGLGIIFKFKGTTAGSDIVAAIMQKRMGVKPGQAIMFIDFFVIALAGIIIGVKGLSPDKHAVILTLYALFLLYVSSRIIDIIIDGMDYARQVFITSDKHEEIGNAIMNKLSRGATAIEARGLYRDVKREMIMTVVSIKELDDLEHIVKDTDPDAFMVITNAHEVQGHGFRRRI
jgi:uncharacterized membrane-anchored protein YitT (DUF2179 family)